MKHDQKKALKILTHIRKYYPFRIDVATQTNNLEYDFMKAKILDLEKAVEEGTEIRILELRKRVKNLEIQLVTLKFQLARAEDDLRFVLYSNE